MDKTRGRWRRLVPWLTAALFYFAFTAVQTWPLLKWIPDSDVIPNDLGDPLLNAWIVWWNAHAVPFTARWWNAPIFHPTEGALAFSEALLGLAPITTPIQWLGGGPVAAYDVAFFLTFPLSALAAHVLVYRLTRRHDAGVIAGLVYGFAPFRVAHFPQIQVLTSYWMPLALVGLHAYVASRKPRWLLLFGVSWLMQALSNGYYLLFFPVLLGCWIAWFVIARDNVRTAAAVIAAWFVASLPLIPLLWSYRRIHAGFGFTRDVGEIGTFGADVLSLLDASPLLKFWHLRAFHQAEGELFPGFTAALLVLLLLGTWLWKSEWTMRLSRVTAVLLIGSAAMIGVALSGVVLGPWAIAIGKTTLVSVRVVSKPFSIGLLLLALAVLTVPRVAATWRRRSVLTFYVLAMALMYLLCFGPQPHFLGTPLLFKGPYSLLMKLPGYDSIRVPARFAMLAMLCVSVVAAMSFARLTSSVARNARLALAALVVCGVIVDSAIGEMPLKSLPWRLYRFESLPPGVAVLELPLGDTGADVAAMYRSMFHGRPVVNGYSGYFPRSYGILRKGIELGDPQIFDAVSAWGPVVVIVDPYFDALANPPFRWTKLLAGRPGTVYLGEEDLGHKAYLIPGGTPPVDIQGLSRLPIHAKANVNGDRMALALDGQRETRWDSGPQQGVEEVIIDLGEPRFIDGITMTINEKLSDFPRSLVIETTQDGEQWTKRWEGSTAVVAFAAAVRHPVDNPLAFALPHAPARWIRLRQLGKDPIFYWSIFELAVYGD